MIIKSEGFVKRGGWWVVAQFLLFGAIVIALTANREAAGVLVVTGWLLIVIAAGFAGSGLYVLRDKLTAMPAPVDGAVLHRHGPFALVRHPIYTGVILGFLGLAIRGANPVAAVLVAGLIAFFYAKTGYEERLLAARFPEYTDYQQAVPYRLLPWLL
jgi:protein-S-isoprenylcysteine O-methyltransferase Ste14